MKYINASKIKNLLHAKGYRAKKELFEILDRLVETEALKYAEGNCPKSDFLPPSPTTNTTSEAKPIASLVCACGNPIGNDTALILNSEIRNHYRKALTDWKSGKVYFATDTKIINPMCYKCFIQTLWRKEIYDHR